MSNLKIIAHRQNTITCDLNEVDGIEFDVWNVNGELMVKHDAKDEGMPLLMYLSMVPLDKILAINTKSSELNLPDEVSLYTYFVFDAAVPESIRLIKNGYRVFTRESDYEQSPAFLEDAFGVWIDQFTYDYFYDFEPEEYQGVMDMCIVSPELHGREYISCWKLIKEHLDNGFEFMLCTKHSDRAKIYFNE